MRKAHWTLPAFGFLLLVFTGCDEPVVAPPSFLTIEASNGYPIANEEWIFATDLEGKVLDVKQVVRGRPLPLQGDVGALTTVTLHHLKVYPQYKSPTRFEAKSYTDVPVGSTWYLASIQTNQPRKHTATVTINEFNGVINYGYPIDTRVSSAEGDVTVSKSASEPNSTATLEFGFTDDDDFVVSSVYENSTRYAFLQDVSPGEHRAVTLNEMDKPLVLDVENSLWGGVFISGFLTGDDPSMGGYINCSFNLPGLKNFTTGYINGFDRYRTSILYGTTTGMVFGYEKVGAPLDQLPTFESPVASASLKSISALTGSISIPFDYAQLTFSYYDQKYNVYWQMWLKGNGSTSFFQKLLKLPDAITSRYPMINIETINLNSGIFTQSKSDYSYLDEIGGYLLRPPYKKDRELYTYQFTYF